MTQFSSEFRPCLRCGMPEFDHGDGSPTDHPFEPDTEWQGPEEELIAEATQATRTASMESRFAVQGNCVLWDGQQFLECVEPEAAQGMVELFREVLRIDAELRTHARAKVRRDRIKLLAELIANPSRRTERLAVEAPEHWAARAVMEEVDGWLL